MIMADPPWRFDLFSTKGEGKAPQGQYACMPLDDIACLPVSALASENSVLMLWATNPMLPQALQVMEQWGFTFKTAGTWIKRTVHGKDAFGTGYVFRSSNEPILIGTRGRPKTARTVRSAVASYEPPDLPKAGEGWPTSTLTIEAVAREHSRKPDEAFDAAERLLPAAARIELFSRQTRPGWASWGHEAGKFDLAV
ncbi:MT-A70 family methyltransferase [uncultured Maricaulis sp.]|uniref:MT-A70 family methyltransferase n=1 Tax=uncultured Maricaulis sp. TaxID=174710 RepID=UPI0030DAAF24|tara:strand:- start:137102 stop:137689 length:588 start_codon:yes stop_codon:yes gene_type:complete